MADSSFPILTVTAALPAVGAVVTAAVPAARKAAARYTALAFSLGTLVLSLVTLFRFDPHGARYQFTETHTWVKSFGLHYDLGVDGIGAVMVALTALLIPFVMLAGWHDADPLEGATGPNRRWRPTQGFFALILMVEAMVVLSFEATDVFLFYIFFGPCSSRCTSSSAASGTGPTRPVRTRRPASAPTPR
jgi:NADH-quinone oxidoreductase subunit M